ASPGKPPSTPGTPLPVPIYPIPVPEGVIPKPPAACLASTKESVCHLQYIDSKTCEGYIYSGKLPITSDMRISIICISGAVDIPGDPTIGILVWGGKPPYALSIDWGDGSDPILKSVDKAGYFTVQRDYTKPGSYTVK